MRLYQVIIFLFLCRINIGVVAQTMPSTNITINDGLPSNTIRCIYKDRRGLLWIGTDAGLCCYDGLNYKVFNETNGLTHDKIWSIVEDEQNNLWLSLYGKGLAKYDGRTFTYFDDKTGLVNNNIRKLHYSKKYKCLVIATENGLALFDGKHFKSFKNKLPDKKFQIVGIDETPEKIIITSSYFGVYNLSINNNLKESKLDSLFRSSVCYSSCIINNTYLSGDANHFLNLKDLETNSEKSIPCPIIWDYARDADKNIYFATCNITTPEGGLFKYSDYKVTDISKLANINSKSLWCLFYDNETQLLWVGTEDKGLYKVDLSKQMQFLNSDYFGLDELQIQELFNDENNNIWIGAKDYIIKLQPDLSFQTIDKSILWSKLSLYLKQKGLNPNSDKVFPHFKIKEGFSSFNITPDKEHNIWVTTTWGLFCFNTDLSIKSFYSSDGGHAIFNNKDQLYFGHMYSDLLIFPNKLDYTQYKFNSVKNKSIPRDISKIIKDVNKLWYASITKGLYMSRDSNFYWINANDCFKENNIKDLLIDSKGDLLIGTNSGRVYITIPKGDSIEILKTYNPNKELYGSSISFISESNNTYFIGTNKGINVIKNDKFIKLINRSEGLSDLQFNSCVKDKNGNVWIAANNGLVQLNVNKITSCTKGLTNSININSIKVKGQSYLPIDTLISWNSFNSSQIKLNYNQNELEILFSNYNSLNADKNVFRYKIVGLSDNWSEYEPAGRIELRAIPNGNYQLIIEGKNIGTGETFKTKTLELIINPPFWKTIWFIIFTVLLGVSLLFGFYRKRIRAIKLKEKEKAELANKLLETRLEALRAQMNPHFTFNAINSIQNFIIDNDTTQALHYLGEFSKLIRQTLENATEKLMPLQTEISFLNSYIAVQKMRFDTIKTSLSIDSTIDKYNTQIPPLIVQPFVENAFEHAFENANADENKIEISFKLEDHLLICNIKDNGKGFNKGDSHSLHQSKGQKLTGDRLALFNREYNTDEFKFEIINLSSVDPNQKGTLVTLTLPLIKL